MSERVPDLKVTEAEFAELIKLSVGRYVQAKFGPGGVRLPFIQSNVWALQHVIDQREQPTQGAAP